MLCRAFVTIALVCAIPSAYSYSAGAPEQACKNMVPQHQVAPQTSEAPYKLTLSKDKLTAGSDEPIHIKVQGNSGGNTIKGFMIQGRIDGKPVGKFVLPKKSKYVQLLNCGSEGVSTNQNKFEIELKANDHVNKLNQGKLIII